MCAHHIGDDAQQPGAPSIFFPQFVDCVGHHLHHLHHLHTAQTHALHLGGDEHIVGGEEGLPEAGSLAGWHIDQHQVSLCVCF